MISSGEKAAELVTSGSESALSSFQYFEVLIHKIFNLSMYRATLSVTEEFKYFTGHVCLRKEGNASLMPPGGWLNCNSNKNLAMGQECISDVIFYKYIFILMDS